MGEIVEGKWRCFCGTENWGHVPKCENCGRPQSEATEFFLPDGPQQPVTDPEMLRAARNGPDVHCPYCGTRNPNGSVLCRDCGGDLKSGKVRKVGDNPQTSVDEGEIQPDYQGGFDPDSLRDKDAYPYPVISVSDPPPSQPVHARTGQSRTYHEVRMSDRGQSGYSQRAVVNSLKVVGGIIIFLFLVFIFWNTFINVEQENVHITAFSWQLKIPIGVMQTFHEQGDTIPPGGRKTGSTKVETGQYEQKDITVEEEVVIKSAEKCGTTPVNKGNGYFEKEANSCKVKMPVKKKVDDTTRPILKTIYFYDIDRWVETRKPTSSGKDNLPIWPEFTLEKGESEGVRIKEFTVYFIDKDEMKHAITTSNWEWFTARSVGEVCIANRNGWGSLNYGITCPAP